MEKLLDLTERVILITGGCGAIGRVVGRVLAEHGATVVANDIVPEDEAAQMFANEGASGPTIGYWRADATRPDSVENMFQQVEERYGSQTLCAAMLAWQDHFRLTSIHWRALMRSST